MNRSYYSDSIESFLRSSVEEILGKLSAESEFGAEQEQIGAWSEEIRIPKDLLSKREGSIYFEFSIPRMGRRIDVVLIIQSVVFVLEFKVGAKSPRHVLSLPKDKSGQCERHRASVRLRARSEEFS